MELVIVVAIMGILIGAAVPAASMYFKSKARRATREGLNQLTEACAEYFRDTFQLPTAPVDLHVDPGATGWNGPYMLTATDDAITGITDSALDAWSRPYKFTAQGTSALLVASAGEDAVFGTEADLEVTLDVTPIRRSTTLDELRTINQAVTLYNGEYLPDNPLPTSYSQPLGKLEGTGFLPSGAGYDADGWGDAYVPDPLGKTPVVKIGSTNLESGASAGAGSTTGGSKSKGKGKGKSGKGK